MSRGNWDVSPDDVTYTGFASLVVTVANPTTLELRLLTGAGAVMNGGFAELHGARVLVP